MEQVESGRREGWPPWVTGRLGERVGSRWRIVGVLGFGGLGVVYEVQSDDGTAAALKMLRTDISVGTEATRRFDRESQLIAEVRSPGLLRILERSPVAASERWYVMERASGAELEELLESLKRPMAARQAAAIGCALLRTLEVCHAAGVVHRDIKPANLFVASDLTVQLTDFGGALVLGEDDTSRVGSAGYMAPEQAVHGGAALDARCDVFGAGAVLFRMVAGTPLRRAADAETALILAATTPPPSLATAAPSAPTELVGIVDKALSFNPADRFPTAAAMLAALESFVASGVESQDDATDEEPDAEELRHAFDAARTIRAAASSDAGMVQEQRRLLREAFRHLAPLVGSVRRRGGDPQETQRKLDRFAEALGAATSQFRGSSLVAVRPTTFAFAGGTVWEPDELLEDVPYAFFSIGVRSFRFTSGFTRIELMTWVQLLASAGERDELVEQRLEPFTRGQMAHIACTMVAAFDVSLVDRLADADVVFGQARREIDAAMGTSAGTERLQWSEAARAMARQLSWAGFAPAEPSQGDMPSSEQRTRALDSSALRERYAAMSTEAIGAALRDAAEHGDLDRLTPAIVRVFRDAIESERTQRALELLETIVESAPSTARQDLLRAMLDDEVLHLLFEQADALTVRNGLTLAGSPLLHDVLEPICGQHWTLLWEHWTGAPDHPIGRQLGAFVLGRAERALPAVAEQLARLPEALLAQVLDTVGRTRDAVAQNALRQLGRHPSEEVRLAALLRRFERGDHVDPGEVQRLVNSANPQTRSRTLTHVRDSGRTGLAAMLATHAVHDDFHNLPLAERQLVLTALQTLSPSQAESVCIELLRPRQWVDETNVAATRQLAAGLLGSFGQSNAAREALRAEAKRLLRSTGEMRAVARNALNDFDTRRQGGTRK